MDHETHYPQSFVRRAETAGAALARALGPCRPGVLLLDEPTSPRSGIGRRGRKAIAAAAQQVKTMILGQSWYELCFQVADKVLFLYQGGKLLNSGHQKKS